MKASTHIRQIINQSNVNINQLMSETGISQHKLVNSSSTFNATEFLRLCQYLEIDPLSLVNEFNY